ncbi:MAG: EmrA/EmrK family multidrug efflux transporter periplasmic adaptor subunit [Deltaproteobacteria bacterium]|nr:MAG: EmrA/EmrK family multidrug efflux transporter periplasmic adaptor subunit [Deltaproteobacteria bacterium]
MSNQPSETPTSSKRKIAIIILILLIVILAIGLFRFIHHRLNYALTNAVFVASDSLTEVGFERVGGVIIELPVKGGDAIRKGQLLARIDPKHYQLTVDKLTAETQFSSEKMEALQLKRQRVEQELILQTKLTTQDIGRIKKEQQAAEARVNSLQVHITQLQRDQQRLTRLFDQQVIPRQKLEKLTTQLESARADLVALQRNKQAFDPVKHAAQIQRQISITRQQQLLELDREIAASGSKIKQLQAALNNSRRDLHNTELKSPLDGRVAKRFINQGGNIAPGRPVLALVDPRDLYIIALLEENKLNGVEPGNAVLIHIDAYTDQQWEGEVEQVLPASAATFALAPRDISAGEFTKVAQRIPVRIRITEGPLEKLRIGLGGEVEIRRQDH